MKFHSVISSFVAAIFLAVVLITPAAAEVSYVIVTPDGERHVYSATTQVNNVTALKWLSNRTIRFTPDGDDAKVVKLTFDVNDKNVITVAPIGYATTMVFASCDDGKASIPLYGGESQMAMIVSKNEAKTPWVLTGMCAHYSGKVRGELSAIRAAKDAEG